MQELSENRFQPLRMRREISLALGVVFASLLLLDLLNTVIQLF